MQLHHLCRFVLQNSSVGYTAAAAAAADIPRTNPTKRRKTRIKERKEVR